MLFAACSVQSRPFPNLDDEAEIHAAMRSLSPYADGRAATADDNYRRGERESDRQVFARFLLRFINHDRYGRYAADFRPMPMPASIGDAIAAQRAYERAAEERESQANAAAAARYAAEAAERHRSAVASQAAREEEARVATAKAEAEWRAFDIANKASSARVAADSACRERRGQAEMRASLDRDDPAGAIARARASITCPTDPVD